MGFSKNTPEIMGILESYGQRSFDATKEYTDKFIDFAVIHAMQQQVADLLEEVKAREKGKET